MAAEFLGAYWDAVAALSGHPYRPLKKPITALTIVAV
jgi:hypothetical protein